MTVNRVLRTATTTLVAVFVLSLPASRLAAQEAESGLPETFSAFAIVMGHIGTGRTEGLTIRITRWSTDEEREHLLSTIVERPEDEDALHDELQDQEETGFVRGDAGTRWPSERLRYARELRDPETGKRRIVLALARPLGFLELWRSSRTLDYTVTIIVLDVDENGEGDGLLMAGTKVNFDREAQRFVLEYYSTEPVRLTNVRKTS